MGITKSTNFKTRQNEMALLLKALAHPARIAIIEHLLKVESCICGDIVDALPLAQPTISQHLKELKNAGLIKGNIEGTSICYCVEKKSIQKISTYLNQMLTQLDKSKLNCC